MKVPIILFACLVAVHGFALPFKVLFRDPSTSQEQTQVATFADNVWVTNVSIGTPGQIFNVMIDTTTSILWVADKSCNPDTGICSTDACTSAFCSETCPEVMCCTQVTFTDNSTCYGKTQYDSSLSSTFNGSHQAFLYNFGNQLVSGVVGVDNVKLGNDDKKGILVSSATFGQVNNIPDGVAYADQVDGVLGLAFPSLAPASITPIFANAISQAAVNKGIFTIWLEDQWETSDNGTHGTIYYGNIDPLHCPNSTVQYFWPLSGASLWQFTLPSFSLNGVVTWNKNTQTVINSTSNYIKAPPSVVNQILTSLKLDLSTTLPAIVPCDTQIDISFNFFNNQQHINQLNLILKDPTGTCRLAITKADPRGTDNGVRFELGIPFLRGRCTFFNQTGQQIGFSDAKSHGGEN